MSERVKREINKVSFESEKSFEKNSWAGARTSNCRGLGEGVRNRLQRTTTNNE